MDDKSRGLLRNEEGKPGKFIVRRADGTDAPGGKHDGCSYFVLDLTHDQHARNAALAYAASCSSQGFEALAADLREEVTRIREAGRQLGDRSWEGERNVR